MGCGITANATVIRKNSIRWIISGETAVGQYVTGDYYAVCPKGCTITAITPEPSDKNGTMLNPVPDGTQGYSSRGKGYNSSLNKGLHLPLSVNANDILISTTARTPDSNKSVIHEAAILTIVGTEPPVHSFRPGYCDINVSGWTESNLNHNRLQKLAPIADTPHISETYEKVARPWIDHQTGWSGRLIHPAYNMPDYGAHISNIVGEIALQLNLNYSYEQKRKALIGLVQIGIDLYSILSAGSSGWYNNGGHSQGRKLPILFAGLILNNRKMLAIGKKSGDYILRGSPGNPPSDYIHFGEDDQTFYVTQSDVDITNSSSWNPDKRNNEPAPYTSAMIGMPEWGIRHASNPERSNASWLAIYRRCCTGASFISNALAARLMCLQNKWNHDALFDYAERYITITQGKAYSSYSVPDEEAGWGVSAFTRKMWDKYSQSFKSDTNCSIK